jgi:hypothetical protein
MSTSCRSMSCRSTSCRLMGCHSTGATSQAAGFAHQIQRISHVKVVIYHLGHLGRHWRAIFECLIQGKEGGIQVLAGLAPFSQTVGSNMRILRSQQRWLLHCLLSMSYLLKASLKFREMNGRSAKSRSTKCQSTNCQHTATLRRLVFFTDDNFPNMTLVQMERPCQGYETVAVRLWGVK